MNLVQQSEQLKNLPDAALLQMQQRPTTVPPYLVVAEMQRRETMRKAAMDQGGQNPMDRKTVSQEMVGQMQQQAAAPPPQQMQGGMGAMKMAGGGPVSGLGAMAQQLEAPPILEGEMGPFQSTVPGSDQMMSQPSMFPRKPGGPAMTLADLLMQHGPEFNPSDEFNAFKKMRGESPLKALADSLASQESETRNRKPKLGEIMMQLGLAMAASRNPSFLGALTDGGIGALQGYTQDRNRREGQADELQRRRLGIMGQIDQNDDQMMQRAVDSARGKNAGRNTEMQSVQAALRQEESMMSQEKMAEEMRKTQIRIAGLNDKRQRDIDAARDAQEIVKINLQHEKAVELEKMRLARKTAGGGGGNKTGIEEERKATGLDKAFNSSIKQANYFGKMAMEALDPKKKAEYEAQASTYQKMAKAAKIASDLIRGIKPEDEGPAPMSPEEALAWASNRPSGGQALTPKQRSMVHGPGDRRQITTEAGKQKQGLGGLFDYMREQKSINDRFANAPR